MFNRKGFTLIELLIVVVIIGILAAIAIPKFATTKDKAKLASIKTDLRNLMTAQEAYFSDYSTYAASVGAITNPPYNFSFSAGNTNQAVGGGPSGWTAAVTNASISSTSTNTCHVEVGGGVASTLDGTIICP